MVDFKKLLENKRKEKQMTGEKWSEPIEPGKPVAIDAEGVVVIGRYLGFSSFVQDASSRESRIHEVELGKGSTPPRGVEVEDGASFRFWGSYDLDQKLRRVSEGETVRIEYKGTEKLPGDREMKKFEVRRSAFRTSAPARGGTDNPPF